MDRPENVEQARAEMTGIAEQLSLVGALRERYAFLAGWVAAQPDPVPDDVSELMNAD